MYEENAYAGCEAGDPAETVVHRQLVYNKAMSDALDADSGCWDRDSYQTNACGVGVVTGSRDADDDWPLGDGAGARW